MIITFCGHRDFVKTKKIENTLIELLEFFAKDLVTIDCYCEDTDDLTVLSQNVSEKQKRTLKI